LKMHGKQAFAGRVAQTRGSPNDGRSGGLISAWNSFTF
jgi:hypothetical protein